MGDRQFNIPKTFWWNEVNWEDKTDEIYVLWYNSDFKTIFHKILFDSVIFMQILPRLHS